MAEWQRVTRVGTPEVKPGRFEAGTVDLTIGTVPTAPVGWKTYFLDKMRDLGHEPQFTYKHAGDGEGFHLRAPEATFERAVEAVDAAIEYANDEYETRNLPLELQAKQHEADRAAAAAQRRDALEERAAKLAKPGEPLWVQSRRKHEG